MKNKALILWLLVAIVALSSSVAFGQSLGEKRFQGVSQSRFATATVLNPDSALPAGVYTVGQTGRFPTIDSAFNKLNRDGVFGPVTLTLIDTLYRVQRGRRFELGPIAGAGPTARITIRPAVGTQVTIRGDSDAVLYFQNTKYVTLDGRSNPPSSSAGITVHALYNPAAIWNDCIDAWGDADNNQFLHLTLKTDDFRNVYPGGGFCLVLANQPTLVAPDSNLIEGNLMSGGHGVCISGYYSSPRTRPRWNIIRGNTYGLITDLHGTSGIASEYAERTLIEGNTVQFLRESYLASDGARYTTGINSWGGLNDTIRNNVVHTVYTSNGAYLQAIWGSGSSTYMGVGLSIYNNMVYDLQNTSTTGNAWLEGIMISRNVNVLVAYNTVRLSGTGAIPGGVDALALGLGIANVTVRNNILVNSYHQTAGGPSTALYVDGAATFTSDYNDLYVTTDPLSYTAYRNVGYLTLSAWQGAGYDPHSLSMLPVFRSATDLHIDTLGIRSQWVPLANTGIAVAGCEWDIDGDNRVVGNNPDIGADEFWISPNRPTGVEQIESELPQTFSLSQNYPNPFNPVTNIQFSIVNRQLTILKVYDMLGREVATLVNEVKQPGTYTVQFDGSGLSSGMYFYRLQAGSFVDTKKFVLLR